MPCQVLVNSATATWTSLPGNPGQITPFTAAAKERTGAGGIDAQGRIAHFHDGAKHLDQQLFFVCAGDAGVNIQNMRAGGDLSPCSIAPSPAAPSPTFRPCAG